MAKKILVSLDLSKNELQNAQIQNLASAPSSPVAGQIYFDTTLHQFGVYNDNTTSWVYLTPASGADASTNTSTSVDGEIALFSGTGGKTLKRATGSGLVKIASGVLAVAASGTDYAPATSGSSILKGNGSGGFSNAASGTDYAPATSGTSALKGNGSGGFSNATLTDVGAPTADYSMGSHKLTNVTDPTSAQDAATKAYVDATAAGIDWKASVRAATTAPGTLTTAYENGDSIDGVTLATGDRILIKDQSSGSENGIYTVNASGAPTRATDADTAAEVTGGMAVFVEEGTTNADTGWVLTNNGAITIGSTSLVFTQFTGLGQVTAGTGLSKTGNTISLTTPVAAANGGAGTVSGILKANGSGTVSAATAGTDYYNPGGTDVAVADGGTGASTAAGARTNLGATTKFTATIGDNSTTAIAVTDNLGTLDKIAQVRDASTNAVVECEIATASNTTTFTFATAPATNAYKVVIIG